MNNSSSSSIAQLPFPENFLLRYLVVPYYLKKYDPQFAKNDYEKLTKLIIRMVNSVEPAQTNQKVKIKRIFGLEEVSTNWSMGMTLEHLTVVGEGILAIIKQLNELGKSEIIVNPANVKPKGEIADPLKSFTDHIQKYQTVISQIDFKKNSSAKLPHPWVGELSQKDWNTFAVIHLQVHLRQIKMIRDELLGLQP